MNWGYALWMLAAIATGAVLARRFQSGLALKPSQKVGIGLGGFCGAMLGARLPFVLSDGPGLISGAAWFSDGKTILLGLVGGYFGVELAKWTLDVRTKTGDSFAVPVAVSIGVGRLACYQAGCCYGRPTSLPWGVRFADGISRHPTQLYEAAFHLSLAALLAWLWQRGTFRTQLIKFYILSYLLFRLVTEMWRPEIRLWLGLTGYQWAALALMPLFIWLWHRDARRLVAEDITVDAAARPNESIVESA